MVQKLSLDLDFESYDGCKTGHYSVYLITTQQPSSRFKIGISKHVRSRLKTLESEAGLALTVSSTIQSCCLTHARYIESCIHFELRRYRKIGEWFDLSKESINNLAEFMSAVDKGIDPSMSIRDILDYTLQVCTHILCCLDVSDMRVEEKEPRQRKSHTKPWRYRSQIKPVGRVACKIEDAALWFATNQALGACEITWGEYQQRELFEKVWTTLTITARQWHLDSLKDRGLVRLKLWKGSGRISKSGQLKLYHATIEGMRLFASKVNWSALTEELILRHERQVKELGDWMDSTSRVN